MQSWGISCPDRNWFSIASQWLTWDNYLVDLLKDPKVIIDIGAAIGYSTILFARNYPNAEIVAIEPVADHFGLLKDNTSPLRGIRYLKIACGERNQIATLSINEGEPNTGKMSVFGGGKNTEHVKMLKLDALHLQPDFIKIDVEGYEKQVLMGGRRTIKRHKPLIQMEKIHGNKEAEEYLLGELGYFRVTRRHNDVLYTCHKR